MLICAGLIVAALLSGTSADAAAPHDPVAPPPGSPADQALWTAAQDVSTEVVVARTLANEYQWAARQNRYDDRLAALAEGPDSALAKRAADVLRRYREIVSRNHTTLTRRWPVDPTRGCRYTALNLAGVMTTAERPAKAAELGAARGEVEECLSRARPALAVMHASNSELERVVAEVEALLPPLEVSTARRGGAPVCRGTLSGSVTATFECVARIVADYDGDRFILVIDGTGPIPGIPSYAPGAFEIPKPIEAKTYTLATLGQGRASVAAEGGTLYVASKTSAMRGEVTVTLRTVTKQPGGAWLIHGTYEARLVPAGGGKSGEVRVEAEF